jgi:DNA repair protein RadC
MTDISPSLYSAAEVELIYRSQVDAANRTKINSSSDAFKILLNAWDKSKIELVEQFSILLLNDANYCLGYSCIHTGGISKCSVDFIIALRQR